MSKWELCQTSSVSVTLFVENLLPPFFLFHGPKPAQKKPFGLCHILTTSAVFETRKTGRYKNRPTAQLAKLFSTFGHVDVAALFFDEWCNRASHECFVSTSNQPIYSRERTQVFLCAIFFFFLCQVWRQ